MIQINLLPVRETKRKADVRQNILELVLVLIMVGAGSASRSRISPRRPRPPRTASPR